ncbi:MAG: sulfite exporter TauE/SafE family protein [Acinetobacter sp.]|nr:sulfite exporter TauE/SafE family protein [Acinetobacter sp.]
MEFIFYLAIGSVSGFCAGLFGIGGGLIIIPCLYFFFRYMHYPEQGIMHLAIGTALASIIISSLSSALAHHKKKAILWPIVKNFVPLMMLGSVLGAWIADQLTSSVLQIVIGLFALWTAQKMFFTAKQVVVSQALPSAWQQRSVAGLIGIASAIFGIAGGSITVPYLNRYGVVMQNAVATSAACGVPIAIMGAVGYLWFGSQQNLNLPQSIGYVHIWAFLGISIASFLTAKLGVKVAHAISAAKLKRYFALELVVVGIYFIYQALTALYLQ